MTLPVHASRLRLAIPWERAGVLASLLCLIALGPPHLASAAPNTITQPDTGGQFTSLKLDGSGRPIVSHYDAASGQLKVVVCGNTDCSSGNTITAPDSMAVAVAGLGHTSLALAGTTPVVTHYDANPKDLKFIHCGNALCSSPTVLTLNAYPPTDTSGIYGSIAINGSGNPVVAYYYEPTDVLKVLVCADATCSSYSTQSLDTGTGTLTGQMPSLVLDASGFPVISYYNDTLDDLKLAHCNNASCTSAVINTVDGSTPAVQVGEYTSLALDAAGFPVISYYDEAGGDLKVVHCGDATCSSGNTIVTLDNGASANVGQYTSLALDASGHPVVSYYNVTASSLKIAYCGNATCTAGNTFVTPDSDGTVGQYTSLALDATGHPVVSYYDATDSKLNVLHCGDPLCVGSPAGVGGLTQLAGISEDSASGGTPAFWWLTGGVVLVAAVVVAAGWRRGSAEG